jgi:phage terminase large subunit
MAEIHKRKIGREKIVADCAEPKSINEYRRNGFNIEGACKGQGSREFGLKWLQSRKAIVIDSVRCPNAWREFSTYELEKKKDGMFKDEYPDKNNHAIDACMYSYEGVMEKRGLF